MAPRLSQDSLWGTFGVPFGLIFCHFGTLELPFSILFGYVKTTLAKQSKQSKQSKESKQSKQRQTKQAQLAKQAKQTAGCSSTLGHGGGKAEGKWIYI